VKLRTRFKLEEIDDDTCNTFNPKKPNQNRNKNQFKKVCEEKDQSEMLKDHNVCFYCYGSVVTSFSSENDVFFSLNLPPLHPLPVLQAKMINEEQSEN